MIGDAVSFLSSIDGYTSTLYLNTVSSTVSAHAAGGYVRSQFQLVGEQGPELVALPYGSYVHTAAETRQMLASQDNYGFATGGGGGIRIASNAINVNVYAETNADAEEIAAVAAVKVQESLIPALSQQRRGMGV